MNKHLNCIGFLIIILLLAAIATGAVEPQQSCRPSGKVRGRKPPPGGRRMQQRESLGMLQKWKKLRRLRLVSASHKSHKSSLDPLTVSRKTVMAADLRRVITSTIPMTCRWWHCRQGGSGNGRDATTTSKFMAMGRVSKAMVVDECDSTKGCDKPQTISHRAETTLLMPLKLFGRRYEFPKAKGKL